MSFLVSYSKLSKSYGADTLFKGISIGFSKNEKLGLIGANGTGKSTLLKIFAQKTEPDEGLRQERKYLKIVYLPQNEKFDPDKTPNMIFDEYLNNFSSENIELYKNAMKIIGKVDFPDLDAKCSELSGGWRKRLSIIKAFIQQPDILFLDEPTNHLDLEGILWLENLLINARFAFVLVSHDRYLLNSSANAILEIGKIYPDGYYKIAGDYKNFIRRREEFLSMQAQKETTLSNKMRRETEWLRRSPKARTTKAQFRIDNAERLSSELTEIKQRNRENLKADFDFESTQRKTKKLLEAINISKTLGGKTLFKNLSLVISPGTCIGLCGANGTGKSTLMHILAGQKKADSGKVKTVDGLKIVYFDQEREKLDQSLTLKQALCPDGDSVIFKDRPVHVVSWAKRFLFKPDQLDMPVSKLSGGEQARVLIAKLMLVPADILILDEPTNDLDIPSLEILESSIQEFSGGVIISTHDRYILDNVATSVIGFDGKGNVDKSSNLDQWLSLIANRNKQNSAGKIETAPKQAQIKKSTTPKFTFKHKFELDNIENKIIQAEEKESELQAILDLEDTLKDPKKLEEICILLDASQKEVKSLYARWEELELLKNS